MNESVRLELGELARHHPQEILLEKRRLEALLKDKCPGQRAETHVLLCALQSGIPQVWMQQGDNSASLDTVMADMVNRLAGNFGMEHSAAGWAVEAWGYALNKFARTEVGKRDWRRIAVVYSASGANAAGRHVVNPDESVLSPGVIPIGTGRQVQLAPQPRLPKDDPNILIVSPGGKGRFPSINHAIAIARPNQRILLEKGTYREGIRLTKEVEIVGDGSPHQVVLEPGGTDGVYMATTRASIRNISIISKPPAGNEYVYAVQVPGGVLLMQDCVITTSGAAAIAIHGTKAMPQFQRCIISSGPVRGVIAWNQAKGVFTDCEIRNFDASCIDVCDWASTTFLRCKIQRGSIHGVHVHSNASPSFVECEISNFALCGISISYGGNPTIDRCNIHHIRSYGIHVSDQGEGTIRNCQFHSNTQPGIYVEKGSRPKIIEGSTIKRQ
ncbi:MAG: right-handed parallel beta-helix repeat-containing protein [Candidatus Methylacidiphilales bacterium]|nr:right-handed parallel beta-helix repeat-containing protein [Candidatus Methylacidiphilales bacterium]